MVDLRKRYETNKDAENAGVWMPFDGYRVKLARLNNDNATAMRKKLQKPFRSADNIPTDMATAFEVQVMAECIVMDWEGIDDDFSIAACKKLLTDCPDLAIEWQNCAAAGDLYNKHSLEQAEKNLLNTSTTRSNGATKKGG